jgi:serine protease Do
MGPAGSKPVAFQRAILTMDTGAQIGKITGGWLNVVHETLKATPGDSPKQFTYIAREELRKAHYTTPGADNALFGEDQSAKARYQLGGEIPNLQLDVHFQPGWSSATVTSRGSMTIDWQVYDTLLQKVVFKKTVVSQFYESVKYDESQSALYTMFRRNVRQLLAQPDFVAFMRPTSAGAADADTPESVLTVAAGGSTAKIELPGDFPDVLNSFVVVEPGAGLGSGFLISSDGYVLTAAHVVTGLKTVPVRLHAGVVLEASVVRLNENADIALLKLPGSSYTPLRLSEHDNPSIGSDVYAVGNPAAKELSASVTRGVISGNREIEGRKFIQTDAAASPGSSGGPLLDKSGHVLGVISWKFAGPEYQGLVFAVPVHAALERLHVTVTP